MLTHPLLYHGKPTFPPEMISLRAGPLTASYDNGDLRYIRYGDHEIIRRLYAAVRDHNWGTVPAELRNVQINQADDHFRITYTAHHTDPTLDIDFEWQAVIEGTADGMIRFEMNGTVNSTFKRNRIGFCVLHPMGLAGHPVAVEHDDASTESGVFPEHIAPHQPFFDIRAIRHTAGDAQAEITFEGEVFEMEDQRNWTDASYKTYCTPLARPFPVEVKTGETIQQAVVICLKDAGAMPAQADSASLRIDATQGEAAPLPQIGLGVASHGHPLTEGEIKRLRALRPAHLRVDLRLNDPGGARLQAATEQAQALQTKLLIGIHLTDNAELELNALAQHLQNIQPALDAFLIYHQDEKSTSSKWVELAHKKLASFDVPIGAGTDAFFTELNRGRPADDTRDFVAFSTNPQVHAFDNIDLAETLACHAPLITTTRTFAQGKAITISPVTLKMRFNPNATGPEPKTSPGELLPQVDTRQMSLFGAGWTLGSLKYLAAADVARITYYETTGWRGVMETEHADLVDPALFPSEPGMVYPMYFVFADVADFAGGELVKIKTSHPLQVEAALLRAGNRQRVLLANLTAQEQTVQVHLPPGEYAVQHLDATNAADAMRTATRPAATETIQVGSAPSLTLKPFAITRLERA